MNTLDRELGELIDEVAPPLLDLALLERLVTADELVTFDGECSVHDGCTPILIRGSS
ncbi:MAG: hypothetical protein Q8M65_03080 [Rhodoglobus sp.]|nr:hypothetical protein [Rhodoglobus sp.]